MEKTDAKCGHTISHGGGTFTCTLPKEHPDRIHEEAVTLHNTRPPFDGTFIERTNWGDDGLAIWATKDPRAKRAPRKKSSAVREA